ncbi:MAG: HAD hydrolase-like protein [Bacteroidota bacterium]
MSEKQIIDCRNIIWDWNGTLLNDLEVCVDSINRLLNKRELSPVSIPRYLDIFTFPVIDYYTAAGFDFSEEPFETVAVEFMDHYLRNVRTARLHSCVEDTLKYLKDTGHTQIILSAMEQMELIKLVKELRIDDYFNYIFGMNNHLAHGKLSLAHSAFRITGFRRNETCLIGDTLHDAEVAKELGIHCLLIADGHQSEERLKASGYQVIRNLREVNRIFGRDPDSMSQPRVIGDKVT